MKFFGGHNLIIEGRPKSEIVNLPDPLTLCLPLNTKRFNFSTICVKDLAMVKQGSVLALDPNNHYVPLLAPRAGVVRLNTLQNHIVLENINSAEQEIDFLDSDFFHIPKTADETGKLRYKILKLGAWEFFEDAFTGALPDPLQKPQAVIVSTLHLEPFSARGDAQLKAKLSSFLRGLEHIQSLLEYQPIYLVFPKVQSELIKQIQDTIRGYAWLRLCQIPYKYPFDNFNLIAREQGLSSDKTKGSVWTIRTQGVLALDLALTSNKPYISRVVAVGGGAVNKPSHYQVMPGYPLVDLLKFAELKLPARLINGGVLTGTTIPNTQKGLDSECSSISAIPDNTDREFLGFTKPGFDKVSYSGGFASSLLPQFAQKVTTALRGEVRPCISCSFCIEVCPAKIMPTFIHKAIYANDVELIETLRPDMCVGCGLCSYVCTSKIDLMEEIIRAKKVLLKESTENKSEVKL